MTTLSKGPASDVLAAAETQQLAALAHIELQGARLRAEIAKGREELCFLCSSAMIVAGNHGCDARCPSHPAYAAHDDEKLV